MEKGTIQSIKTELTRIHVTVKISGWHDHMKKQPNSEAIN